MELRWKKYNIENFGYGEYRKEKEGRKERKKIVLIFYNF